MVFAASLIVSALFAAPPPQPEQTGQFTIFDNIGYRGKPALSNQGLSPMNIVYEAWIWPGRTKGTSGRKSPEYGKTPDEATFKEVVGAHCKNPGPIVLDIEYLPLTGAKDTAKRNEILLATLVRWTQQAAPGHPIGFYGLLPHRGDKPSVESERELAKNVDAFFPSMYTFDDDQAAWKARCASYVQRSHDLAAGKPVYVYLWPQYHENTPKDEQFIDHDYWLFQLETAKRSGADGAVIWSSDRNLKSNTTLSWDPDADWWRVLQTFATGG